MDDTLYDESSFVASGIKAVAQLGSERFGWPVEQSEVEMNQYLAADGRGAIFDRWAEARGETRRSFVRDCVRTYRHHQPDIALFESARLQLESYSSEGPVFVVTDGHKVAQWNKAVALGLPQYCERVLITHRFGTKHAKPSEHCFDVIRKQVNCEWSDLVYVGDNPAKDFVALNKRGGRTIRVLTGRHSKDVAQEGFEAQTVIPDLSHLPSALGDMSVPTV